jgi:16S rRNA (guanine527-N7)-methyltransferase
MFYRNTLIQSLTDTLKGMVAMHASLKGWMEEVGVDITEAQFDKLAKYLQLLKEKNEVLNLTRITDNREAWIKHILDSLMAAPFFNKPGMMVADIGTGGGLPGIPLAILFPSAKFTLVDSTEKKVAALEEFVRQLGLRNVICVTGRIEMFAHQPSQREYYDLVLARALAPLRILVELAVPLIHPYGNVIAYKGPEYINELSFAQNAIQKLHAESPRVYQYSLPEDRGHRSLLRITKKEPSPDIYPRREGIPNKRPL